MEMNKRVVFPEKGKVDLVEVPMPEPKANEVLVKTIVSQISTGTELTYLEGKWHEESNWGTFAKYPFYPGYSAVGEVIAVGEGVSEDLIGKRVYVAYPHAKYIVANMAAVWEISEGVDPDEAVFGAIAQITMGSIRAAEIRPGETVLVFGAGLIGQFIARWAKMVGALKVFVADVSDERLALLPDEKEYVPVNTKNVDIIGFLKENNYKRLADVVFETTAYAPLIGTELKCVARTGKFVVTSSHKEKCLIDLEDCNMNGIKIIGAHNHAVHPEYATALNRFTAYADLELYLRFLETGKEMSLKKMITHKANGNDAPDMFNMLLEDRSKALAVHLYWED